MVGIKLKVITCFAELKQEIQKVRCAGKTIGFVPTMGFLHDGHLSLLKEARKDVDFVVMSIFVNPTQFGHGEDFAVYPQDMAGDCQKGEENGCDLIFNPRTADMYPAGYATYVNVERLTKKLCGASRPTHFQGVTTVVAKFFNLVCPDRVYFGQKDAQQALVIKKMAEDLNLNLEIVVCPTVREDDGLAMSSRNVNLTEAERKAAPLLYKTLINAEQMIHLGERNTEKIREYMRRQIAESIFTLDYAETVNADTLEDIDIAEGRILLALAVNGSVVRLIDNIILEVI